jgi:hypothetical protein
MNTNKRRANVCCPTNMKVVILLFTTLWAAAELPTDAELLESVRGRGTLERVTPVAVDMRPVGDVNPHDEGKFHLFVNLPAVLPMFDPWGKFPVGSLLVKEKFDSDGKSRFFTGMWKREAGYLPELGDWEIFTVDGAVTKVLERGKLAIGHKKMTKGDFVARDYLVPAQITDGRIILHSSHAKTHGEKLRYEPEQNKNTLGYWTNPADWAEWEFQVTRPGKYEIHLWQGCGTGCGGSEVGIVAAGERVDFRVEETGHFQNFKERVVGQVNFVETGPQRLEVRVCKMAGPAVMDLRLVVLTPVVSGVGK